MTGYRPQARAWARVARAVAITHGPPGPDIEADIAANGELFGAIEFAITNAGLALRDIVDAYTAGAPDLDLSEAY